MEEGTTEKEETEQRRDNIEKRTTCKENCIERRNQIGKKLEKDKKQ